MASAAALLLLLLPAGDWGLHQWGCHHHWHVTGARQLGVVRAWDAVLHLPLEYVLAKELTAKHLCGAGAFCAVHLQLLA
jgi:hypothetical protein